MDVGHAALVDRGVAAGRAGIGFRKGWIQVKWEKMAADTNLPFLADPGQPLRWLGDQ
jgi:hypothetical protein